MRTITSADAAILSCNPFEADDTDCRVLRNEMVVTRFKHDCSICFDQICERSRVRAQTEVNNEDRKVKTFYFCVACCDAMRLDSLDNDCVELERRYEIGRARAQA